MSVRTPNLGLYKPYMSEVVAPTPFNDNSDILDDVVGQLRSDMTQAKSDIAELQSGSAIAAIVVQETQAYLAQHGAQAAYVQGHGLYI